MRLRPRREGDSDWSDGSPDGKKRVKRVPEWAQGPALHTALQRQSTLDPDAVFPPNTMPATCDLEGA